MSQHGSTPADLRKADFLSALADVPRPFLDTVGTLLPDVGDEAAGSGATAAVSKETDLWEDFDSLTFPVTVPGSTTVTNSQTGEIPPGADYIIQLPTLPAFASVSQGGLVPGGEDWMEWRGEGSWDPKRWPELRARLIAAKEAAKRRRGSGAIEADAGDNLVVTGKTPDDRAGFTWDFLCKWRGNVICIRDCQSSEEGKPAVKIELHSEFLMQHGGQAATALVLEMLRSLGGFLRGGEGLTRVDIAFDVVGEEAENLIALINGGYAVKDLRSHAKMFGHPDEEGVYVVHSWACGTDIQIRVYAKPRELLDKPAAGKEAILRECRWGVAADVPLEEIKAFRVEFQIRRDALRRMCVKSPDDWFKHRSTICSYLLNKWFRVCENKPDRKNGHQGRETTPHRVWQMVIDACAQVMGRSYDQLKRPDPKPAALKNLVMGGFGYLTAIAARSHLACTTLHEGLSVGLHYFMQECERIGEGMENVFLREVLRKRLDYEAATGAVIIHPSEIPF